MKMTCFLLLLMTSVFCAYAQDTKPSDRQRKNVTRLIDQYSQARASGDTLLLKKILTADIDQLVSTGEWRLGIGAAVKGMMKSAASNPGSRTLAVDKIRMVTPACAIADCRYEITNAKGKPRKMWSSFIVVMDKDVWKIFAIRNMLPAANY